MYAGANTNWISFFKDCSSRWLSLTFWPMTPMFSWTWSRRLPLLKVEAGSGAVRPHLSAQTVGTPDSMLVRFEVMGDPRVVLCLLLTFACKCRDSVVFWHVVSFSLKHLQLLVHFILSIPSKTVFFLLQQHVQLSKNKFQFQMVKDFWLIRWLKKCLKLCFYNN